jgi:hypothetical protein
MTSIFSFPTDKSPLIGTNKKAGWSQCSNNCSATGCKKCIPSNTDCGQMVSGSGIGCVPEASFAECCLDTENSASFMNTLRINSVFNKNTKISLIVIIVFIIIFFGIYIYTERKERGGIFFTVD